MKLNDPQFENIIGRRGSFQEIPVAQQLKLPRGRLGYRWTRFALQSAKTGDWDFFANGLKAASSVPFLAARDASTAPQVRCPICLWQGSGFYPNVGPGYNEQDSLCPGCGGLARQRDLLLVLAANGLLSGPKRVVEVAPMRGFEKMLQSIEGLRYTSFDLERNAMIKGDITAMPFADGEVDVFLCFHVLEHIPRVDLALKEIRRVLSPSGVAVIQVPVDWKLERSYEYGKPDPRDVGHVRRYGADVRERIAEGGFSIRDDRSIDHVSAETAVRLGLSDEPILLASRAR